MTTTSLSLLRFRRYQPKQQFAANTLANEILYGGATRGGKTAFNKLFLIRILSAVSNIRADIFRLQCEDVYASYMEGEFSFPELLGVWERDGLVKITQMAIEFLWNGSGITLQHLGSDKAKMAGQGIPKQIRIFDEATQLMESRIRFLRGWCDITEGHKEIAAEELLTIYPEMALKDRLNFFPKIIYSTNPIGDSAGYFRRNFVQPAPPMTVFRAPDADGGFTRIFIPALVGDNKKQDPDAVRRRILGVGDEAMADALLTGNWDSPVGDFIREYNSNTHVVDDFEPPEHWVKYRGFDWGHAEPFCVLWAAISDGEPFKDEHGVERWFRRNALIIYREWYGCNPDPNRQDEGLRISNKEICEGILAQTYEPTTGLTITDSLPFQARGGELMATEFFRLGVPLTRGNTDRIIGWKKVQDMFRGIDGYPMLLITRSCRYLQEYIPALQRHKTKINDAVEDGEATHSTDTLRLIAMTHQISLPKTPEKITPLDAPHLRRSMSPAEIMKMRKRANNGRSRISR